MKQETETMAQRYAEAHKTAVVFEVSDRDELTLTGRDRQTFLHGFTTNDIKKLSPGQGCEAFVPTIKGKTLGHVFIFHEQDQLILDTVPGANETLLPHLDRYLIVEDVQLQVTQKDRALFYMTGPESLGVLEKLTGKNLSLAPLQSITLEIGEAAVTVRRVDWFLQPGVQLRVALEQAPAVQTALEALGLSWGEPELWDVLRVEAIFPQFGVDFQADHLAQEIDRTSQAISFHKGCYLGQEPIARIDALGHVNRLLRGLNISHWAGVTEELIGAALYASSDNSKVIGQISSAVEIPGLSGEARKLRAIGIIRREFAESGQAVIVRQNALEGAGEIVKR